ncbi:substrate-binding protein [Mycolicibacterium austroafricanum]|uniref:Substrate-binding protein n=1 Tax=Mycolicibacterium austroafricanum TaxID=39687 RepID=A0ABT8HJ20_MYCAO|nr:substrate-binding protein [Mycolicibacterium austroafricanum]MDN4520505.1 substrate-binding protein [Mycolicibacterium austroafricanum]
MSGRGRATTLAASAFAAVMACTVASCSSDAADDNSVLIAIPVGLTGANSVVAPGVVQASELAADQINADGGILGGRQVKLKIYDDQSGANGALKAFTAAVREDNVVGIVGMETTAARNAGQPIAAETNTPYVYTSGYEGKACAQNLFINGSTPEQSVNPLIAYIDENMGAKTWAIVASDYAYGRDTAAFFEQAVKDSGGEVVSTQFNPVDSGDWTSALQNIRSAEPDVVVSILAAGTPSVTLSKQWKQSGLAIPHVNLGMDEDTAKTIGADAAGVLYPSMYFTGNDSPENKEFMQALQDKFGDDAHIPNQMTVPQYVGVHLLAEAIDAAGSTDPAAVLAELPNVAFEGPSGPVQINKQHHAELNYYLGEVKQDGTTEVVADFGLVDPGEQCPELQSAP